MFFVKNPSEAAYKVEAPIKTVSSDTSASGAVDIKALLAMGTIEHGQKVFK